MINSYVLSGLWSDWSTIISRKFSFDSILNLEVIHLPSQLIIPGVVL